MKKRIISICPQVTLALASVGFCAQADAQNFARGQELYNQQCQSCHEDLMHSRNRKLKTLNGLRSRIQDWSSHTGNSWSAEEIEDVLYYLNKSFYHFDQKPL